MSIASKLQIKSNQSVSVINQPSDVELDLGTNSSAAAGHEEEADALVVFCADSSQLEAMSERLVAGARRDAVTWAAYPKAGQLGTDLNRDKLRELLVPYGIRPVRQVSLDEVWSALRVRSS